MAKKLSATKQGKKKNAAEDLEALRRLQAIRRINHQKQAAAARDRKRKASATQQWMRDHPDDLPCPASPDAAAAWRLKRGIYTGESATRAQWEKYEAAMAEKRGFIQEVLKRGEPT